MILSDVALPSLEGLALARAVRVAGITVPMLAVSEGTGDDDRLTALTAGFDGYLTKPFSASSLLREIAVQEATQASRRAPARTQLALAPGKTAAAPGAITAAPTRPRGVLGGLVVIAMGLPFVLQPLGVPNAASYLFLAMGIAFLISFLRGHQYVYLIPMVTLTSFGIALLLPTWIAMRPETVAPSFVAIVALGFVAAFVLVPDRRWPLIPAALLGSVAAGRFITGTSFIPGALEPFLVPLVLVFVGAYLLVERRS